MGAGLAVTVTVLSAAVYIPAFAFFADQLPPSCDSGAKHGVECLTLGSCSGIDCLFEVIELVFNFLVFLFGLVTLGGLTNIVDPLLRFSLLFVLGIMWALVIFGQLRGAAQA